MMIEDLLLQYWSTLNSRRLDKNSKNSLRGSVQACSKSTHRKLAELAICHDPAVKPLSVDLYVALCEVAQYLVHTSLLA